MQYLHPKIHSTWASSSVKYTNGCGKTPRNFVTLPVTKTVATKEKRKFFKIYNKDSTAYGSSKIVARETNKTNTTARKQNDDLRGRGF